MAYAKLLLVLLSAKLVFSRLDRATDCCVTILSASDVTDKDPYGPGDPYIILEGAYDGGGVPVEIAQTETKPIKRAYFNEEFCGGGADKNDALDNVRYDFFVFKAYADVAQSNDIFIGATGKQYIRNERCCDNKIRTLQLVDSSGSYGAGFLKVKIQCDYNCATEMGMTWLPPADDVKPCEYNPSGQSDPIKEDTSGDRSDVAVYATATFNAADSDVDGVVEVDNNGNVFIDLDLPKLDTSDCNELEYRIYSKNDYDDLKSRRDCDENKIGAVFNPFETDMCDADKEGDMYFECATGDLSGRCDTIKVDNNNSKVKVDCNVSEQNSDKEGGFCKARLTPESLYKRSIAFECKDSGAKTKLFCAGFEVTNSYKSK